MPFQEGAAIPLFETRGMKMFERPAEFETCLPMRILSVDVRTEVIGAEAHTHIEMVIHNPNESELKGELHFSLLDGQTVAGFVLGKGDDELHLSVPGIGSAATQALAKEPHARIDAPRPSKGQGNTCILPVHSLPARGTRRIALDLGETLSCGSIDNSKTNTRYIVYRLPLHFAQTVDQLNVTVHNGGSPGPNAASAVSARLGKERIEVSYAFGQQPPHGSLVSFSRQNYSGKEMLSIEFPHTNISIAAE